MRIAILCTILAVAAASPATSQQSKRQLVEELLRITRAQETTTAFLVHFIAGIAGESPDSDTIREHVAGDLMDASYIELYERHLSEKQIRDLIRFFQSDLGQTWIRLQNVLASEGNQRLIANLQQRLQEEMKGSQVRRTMADMRTLATAAEAYATDYNRYPAAKDVAALAKALSPTYMREPPTKDAWGTNFAWVINAKGDQYRIASAGPDKKFEKESRRIGDTAWYPGDDLIFQNGEFLAPAGDD